MFVFNSRFIVFDYSGCGERFDNNGHFIFFCLLNEEIIECISVTTPICRPDVLLRCPRCCIWLVQKDVCKSYFISVQSCVSSKGETPHLIFSCPETSHQIHGCIFCFCCFFCCCCFFQMYLPVNL